MTKNIIKSHRKALTPLIATLTICLVNTVYLPSSAQAANTAAGSTIQIADASGTNNAISILNSIFGHIYTLFAYIGGGIAVIYIMWAGITYLTAAGDPKKADEGKKGLINAFTGVIVLTSTYVIIRLAISIGNFIAKGL